MKNIFLLLICIFCLISCNDKNENNSILNDCPIINSKLILFKDVDNKSNINKLPTINQFFEALQTSVPISKNLEITWDSPKKNYYVFNVNIIDVATNATENMKFGTIISASERAILTDVWIDNEYIPTNNESNLLAVLMVVNPLYQKAIEFANKTNSAVIQNNVAKIKLGSYTAEYAGGTAIILLNNDGEGFFEAETINKIKWKQVNSELEIKIYGEEGSPQFSETKAKIISETSFILDKLVYNLVSN